MSRSAENPAPCARVDRREDEVIRNEREDFPVGVGRSTGETTPGGRELSAVDRRRDHLELVRGLEQIGAISTETVDDAAALAIELERLRDHIDSYRDEQVDAESVRPPE